jgi:acyl-ACP thioesterase
VLESDHARYGAVNRINEQFRANTVIPVPTTPEGPPEAMVDRPERGRVVEGARKVRLGDVSPAARLRLDAAARYLQDVSADDTADADLPEREAWVVRRTVIEVRSFPRYLEPLALATWCSGTGSHYAERRVQVVGEMGGRIEAASLWVHLDHRSGRPLKLSDSFAALYSEAAGGRRIKGRLLHPGPPAEGPSERWPWRLRFTDFDVLSHVNNAAYWEVVEEVLATRPDLRAPLRAELEHRSAIERGADVEVLVDATTDAVSLWILADGAVAATAVVRPLG